MFPHLRTLRAACFLGIGLPFLGACGSPVTVTYQEIATCHFVEGGAGGSFPGTEYFIFYKIVSVNNPRNNADFPFCPSCLVYQADTLLPLALPPSGSGIPPLTAPIIPGGTVFTAHGDKGMVGLQGPEREAVLSLPSHPLIYDRSGSTVNTVAAPFNRVDLDMCSLATLRGL